MRQLTISKSITNRDTESVNKYLSEISRIEMITPEEESRLARAIKQGDQNALDSLTKANLRFVVSVAKQYQFKGLSLPDLINEGNVGLIKAAQRFDETRGFKFISYAVWWIRQSIIQALTEKSRLVRLPGNRVNMSLQIQSAFNQLEQEHERAPSTEELADALNITSVEIAAAVHLDNYHVSLDAPLGENNEGTLVDFLKADEKGDTDNQVAYSQSLSMEVQRCINTLDSRQQDIICSYFGIGELPMTIDEVCQKYELTKERVRQIKDKALRHLRNPQRSHLLKAFLGS